MTVYRVIVRRELVQVVDVEAPNAELAGARALGRMRHRGDIEIVERTKWWQSSDGPWVERIDTLKVAKALARHRSRRR